MMRSTRIDMENGNMQEKTINGNRKGNIKNCNPASGEEVFDRTPNMDPEIPMNITPNRQKKIIPIREMRTISNESAWSA